MARHSSDIMALARRGAEHRVKQLQDELATIQKHFPDLVSHAGRLIKRNAATVVAAVGGVSAEGGAEGHGKRKRRNLTAAEKRAIGLRMKKYWAARRKAKKAGK